MLKHVSFYCVDDNEIEDRSPTGMGISCDRFHSHNFNK
uniref:Uncharacterized protein n=1 Tax=Anguilla anguilla TaxID=7936 RepID=A0A0E9T7Y7_ANGAN